MMAVLQDVRNELDMLLPRLERVSSIIENDLYAGDKLNEETRFVVDYIRQLNYLYLSRFVGGMQYLSREVRYEGRLRLQDNGRYEVDGCELSSGMMVELHVYDENEGRYDWMATRIEHSHKYGGYYAYDMPDFKLEGIQARVRR